METIQERVVEIINYYFNGNESKMAREFMIPQSTLKGITGKPFNKPSFDIIYKILSNEKYQINPVWFIIGKGEKTLSNAFSLKEPKALELNEPQEPYGINYKDKFDTAKDEINKLKDELYKLNSELKDVYKGIVIGKSGSNN